MNKLKNFPQEGRVYDTIESLEELSRYLVNRPYNKVHNHIKKSNAIGIAWNSLSCWWLSTDKSFKKEYKISELQHFYQTNTFNNITITPNLEISKWYKWLWTNNNKITYGKISYIGSDCFNVSEGIHDNTYTKINGYYHIDCRNLELLKDLSEIQNFLLEGHIDKIIINNKNNIIDDNFKVGDYVEAIGEWEGFNAKAGSIAKIISNKTDTEYNFFKTDNREAIDIEWIKIISINNKIINLNLQNNGLYDKKWFKKIINYNSNDSLIIKNNDDKINIPQLKKEKVTIDFNLSTNKIVPIQVNLETKITKQVKQITIKKLNLII